MEAQTYKIITLGSYGVGKTCLLLRATQDLAHFPQGYQCTIGVDFKTKFYDYNNESFKLTLWDTAGQERFYHINRLYYKDCDGVFLVFDVGDRESFNKIRFFYDDFLHHTGNRCAFVMIGNKIDQNSRKVTTDEAERLAFSLKMPLIECSAFTGENLSSVFDSIIQEIIEKRACTKPKMPSFIIQDKRPKKPVSKCC
jgi:small GTP-binding protein